MRRSIFVLGVLLAGIAAACGDFGASSSGAAGLASPTAASSASVASVTPSPSVAPTHLPGSSVRITVNGGELRPGATGLLADAGTSIVVLTFPVAMARASVETWLPRGDIPSWNDDQTLSLSIAASETLAGFKVPESRSKDGATVIDIFFVPLEHAPSVVVSTFTVAELLSGARPPKAADATRVSIGRGYVAIASPDGSKLLTFLYGGAAPDPHVVDIAARRSVAVSVPSTTGPLIVAGWAGNDRVVFVGERVWVSGADGSAARAVADLRGLPEPNGATVSPSGALVAVGSITTLAVADLATGAARTLPDHRAACGANTGSRFAAWSNDERRLAVVECAADGAAATRIIDVTTDRTVASVAGGIEGIIGALNGDLLVSRDSGEHGEGARGLWVAFSYDGAQKAQYLARVPSLSPNGRYLIDPSCCAGEGFSLRDLQAPAGAETGTQGSAQWLRDGRVLVIQH